MRFSPAIDCMNGKRDRHRQYCTYGVDIRFRTPSQFIPPVIFITVRTQISSLAEHPTPLLTVGFLTE